jgi:murein L,D-transpeptidase YcbB/YkuD
VFAIPRLRNKQVGVLGMALALILVCSPAPTRAEEWPLTAAREMRQRLHARVAVGPPLCARPGMDLHRAVIRFYQVRAFRPAWVDRRGLRSEGAMTLAAVYQAADQGLRYDDYRTPWLEALLDGMITRPVIVGKDFEGRQVRTDLAITEMVLRYAWDRTQGRTDSAMGLFGPPAVRRSLDRLAVGLAEALDGGRLHTFLDTLGPRHAGYRALEKRLPRYRRIARSGGWPVIAAGPKLAPGDCGPRVVQLRRRLAAGGDLSVAAESGDRCFGGPLADALRRFQRRHGLESDGVLGDRTLAALNVPVEARVRQIRLSLERWRWLPADPGPRHLLVNIPGFELQVVEAGKVVKTMRTVVGRQRRATPELAGAITYLELNPYWYVPHRIAREDLLPKIKADPGFIARQAFRVFDGWAPGARELDPAAIDWANVSASRFPYRLRQEPAGANALGRVKFIFPNPMDVYLHDTPAKGLFRKASRPFSSGCVRVEDPLALASLLLAGQAWDAERLARAVASNQRQVVTLEEPVPVYLVYLTAWVAVDGTLQFREDVYGRDQALSAALAAQTAARRACRRADAPPAYAGDFDPRRQRL